MQTLELRSGRVVRFDSLEQSYVYAGLLEGAPLRKLNDRMVTGIVGRARSKIGHGPYLVPPTQTPLPTSPHYDGPERARLPSIVCIAVLFSYKPARDPQCDCSGLTVVWFQEHYAFPIAPEAEQALMQLDWERLARDGLR